jgi:fermentation-respiration switch protein FrsA (DUF1100 family)
LPELTRLAFIARSHSASDEEARKRAHALSLAGVADKIECPLFVIAGGLDRLCPPEDARKLAAAARGPVELLVIEDGNHVAHNRFYKYRARSADWKSSSARRRVEIGGDQLRHGSAAAFSTNTQRPVPSGAGNGAMTQPSRWSNERCPAVRQATTSPSDRTATP